MRKIVWWSLYLSSFVFILLAKQSLFAQAGSGYDFIGNGKKEGPQQSQTWQLEIKQSIELPERNEAARAAARANRAVARRYIGQKIVKIDNLTVTGEQLYRTAREIDAWLHAKREGGRKNNNKNSIAKNSFPFKLYRSKGEDGKGNVHFTGYFIPRLDVAAKPDARFRYPLYRFPKNLPQPLPTREEIDKKGALAGRGLELAWADDLLAVYFLQVQGSGRLRFTDGHEIWVTYDGSNGHPYKSLGRMLVERGSIPAEKISLKAIRDWMTAHPEDMALLYNNPSYIFFKETTKTPIGAAGIPIIPAASVAADQAVIPAGAVLLAEVPILDTNGVLIGHEMRLLFAHDTGSAIKGPGHLDLFFGIGPTAGERAGYLHHYGRVWLVLAP